MTETTSTISKRIHGQYSLEGNNYTFNSANFAGFIDDGGTAKRGLRFSMSSGGGSFNEGSFYVYGVK